MLGLRKVSVFIDKVANIVCHIQLRASRKRPCPYVHRTAATPGSPAYREGPVAGDVHALGERCLDED